MAANATQVQLGFQETSLLRHGVLVPLAYIALATETVRLASH